MNSNKGQILIVEDNTSLAESLKNMLELEGFDVTLAGTVALGLEAAERCMFDTVITDLQLPGGNAAADKAGLELVAQLHASDPQLPIVLMTAYHTTETAIEATKLGAYDYILKPFDPAELLALIRKAMLGRQLVKNPVEMGNPQSTRDAIIGQSRAMQAVYKNIGRFAGKNVTVLLRGETGTGKELVARALYQHSDRQGKPFIVVNCVAIPETLLESELFGHEQGAFTGAATRRIGRFEQAHGGTIFLDEIGDMTMSTQAKLLRVLQEKTIQRLGGREPIQVNVRVIAATHRDLEAAIRTKEFREDLYYRLNVTEIHLPSLRERREDIPLLVGYFLHRYGSELGASRPVISAEAMRYLEQQTWSGNVRELENLARKALLQARGLAIDLEQVRIAYEQSHLPQPDMVQSLSKYIGELLAQASQGDLDRVHAILVETCERELFAQALRLADGNQARVAKWLGLSRPTVREKLVHFGLHQTRDTHGPDQT